MTAPVPQPRDPWAALARHLTTRDPWRRVPFVAPPPMPDHDDTDQDHEERPA